MRWLVIATVLLLAGPALAQDNQALLDRLERQQREIERLQRDMDVLQVRIARAGAGGGTPGVAPPANAAALYEERFSALERALREVTNRLERTAFEVQQLQRQVERGQADTDLRLRDVEGNRPGQPGPTATPPAGGTPPRRSDAAPPPINDPPPRDGQRVVLVPGPGGQTPPGGRTPPPAPVAATTPEQDYEAARGLMVRAQRNTAQLPAASTAWQNFLEANPNHRLALGARYYLGETLRLRRDYNGAAREFGAVYQRAPQGDRAPDALLGLAQSLRQMNQRDNACGFLQRLIRDYPRASEATRTQARREAESLRCQV